MRVLPAVVLLTVLTTLAGCGADAGPPVGSNCVVEFSRETGYTPVAGKLVRADENWIVLARDGKDQL